MISNGINAVNRNAGQPYWGHAMENNTPDKTDNINKWIFFISIFKKEKQRYGINEMPKVFLIKLGHQYCTENHYKDNVPYEFSLPDHKALF